MTRAAAVRTLFLAAAGVFALACVAPAREARAFSPEAVVAIEPPMADEAVASRPVVMARPTRPASTPEAVPEPARPRSRVSGAPVPPEVVPDVRRPRVGLAEARAAVRAAPDAVQAGGSMAARILRQASAKGLGDRYMADLMVDAVSSGAVRDAGAHEAFLGAALTISSDRDRVRALGAYIASGPDENALVDVINVAVRIGPDRGLADVLLRVAALGRPGPSLRPAMLEAAGRIGSDRDRRRVLVAIGS